MSEEASAVIAQAVAKGISLAVAESLTGGAVAADLVSIPGASAVFRGGIVAYDPVIKHDLLRWMLPPWLQGVRSRPWWLPRWQKG